MGKTKTQRETRDFSMALVIKTNQNKTHQNNNDKKHKLFWEGTGTYQFILGEGGTNIIIIIIYSLKNLFEEMGEGPWPQPIPLSLHLCHLGIQILLVLAPLGPPHIVFHPLLVLGPVCGGLITIRTSSVRSICTGALIGVLRKLPLILLDARVLDARPLVTISSISISSVPSIMSHAGSKTIPALD
jgi:hypothetical protein